MCKPAHYLCESTHPESLSPPYVHQNLSKLLKLWWHTGCAVTAGLVSLKCQVRGSAGFPRSQASSRGLRAATRSLNAAITVRAAREHSATLTKGAKSMKRRQISTTAGASVRAATSDSIQAPDLRIASPDLLANWVREALSSTPPAELPAVYEKILAALKKTKVNIGSLLLLLGIPAESSEQLTAPEIGKVIRYLRINDANAMNALFPVLSELLASHPMAGKPVKISRQAA